MSSKIPSQYHLSRRRNRNESSRGVERVQEFCMVHFPDRPLKRISYRDIPRESECRQILLDWKTGKVKPPRVVSNPQLITATTKSLPDGSHQSTHSTVYPQSPIIPPFTCPLCRSPSNDNQGGLCSTCKAEFAMSFSDSWESDMTTSQSSSRFKLYTRKARCYYSSSVYSLDTCFVDNSRFSVLPVSLNDVDDPILPVSPSSIIEDASAPALDTNIPAIHQNQDRGAVVEIEQLDLYDLDWAEYYFDENNFVLKKCVSERLF